MVQFEVHSDNFSAMGLMPRELTCEGEGKSPHLAWVGFPKETKTLVLIVDDPDAPDPKAPKQTWTHWLLYNIPPTTREILEGIATKDLPNGTLEGTNDWNKTGYGGPCPPIGKHRYVHKLYALDTVLPDLKKPTRARLERAMEGHILGKAQLIGLYQKSSHNN